MYLSVSKHRFIRFQYNTTLKMGLRHHFINSCVNTFFEHGTYMLLFHRYSKFLIYALFMSLHLSLHSKFFNIFGIKVKTLYTSKNCLWYLLSECVVNILISLGEGSSDTVDANLELNSTNLHFHSQIVFIFYVS